MQKGIYVALSSAVLRSRELESVTNNLANVSTVGYKKTSTSSRFYDILEGVDLKPDAAYPKARAMTDFNKYHIDTSEGNIKTTGNPLDLALMGEGFFVVQKKGQNFYSRNGALTLDKDNTLMTGNGYKVLDTNGKPITIENNGSLSIAQDGTINLNGEVVGKFKVVKLKELMHEGDSLYSGSEAGASAADVVQGSLEMSNVNPVREMVGVITALRQYESAQKIIQNFEDLSKRAFELARA
ncbi:MAG: flagellar basal-body rod protein FlgF [Nitrospirae bacterium]|nr:MAG: flagellar basal-body rod protein FlgF [Nitrospirota bacterium]